MQPNVTFKMWSKACVQLGEVGLYESTFRQMISMFHAQDIYDIYDFMGIVPIMRTPLPVREFCHDFTVFVTILFYHIFWQFGLIGSGLDKRIWEHTHTHTHTHIGTIEIPQKKFEGLPQLVGGGQLERGWMSVH